MLPQRSTRERKSRVAFRFDVNDVDRRVIERKINEITNHLNDRCVNEDDEFSLSLALSLSVSIFLSPLLVNMPLSTQAKTKRYRILYCTCLLPCLLFLFLDPVIVVFAAVIIHERNETMPVYTHIYIYRYMCVWSSSNEAFSIGIARR